MTYSKVGIDLGSTSTKIYIENCGLAANIKSVVAINKITGALLEIGTKAYDMIGKTPNFIMVEKPLQSGVVANFELTKMLVDEIFLRILKNPIKKTQVFLSVHSNETSVEKLALINAAFFCKYVDLFLIEESIASGFGLGLNLNYVNNLIIVNIGGGTTDMVYLKANKHFISHSVKIGGQAIDEAIYEGVLMKYGLIIGKRSAENLKIQVANLTNVSFLKIHKVKGKCKVNGLPKVLFLSEFDVFELIKGPVEKIINEIFLFAQNVSGKQNFNNSKIKILLTGGSVLIKGFAKFVENFTKIKTTISFDPIGSTICGIAHLIECENLIQNKFIQQA